MKGIIFNKDVNGYPSGDDELKGILAYFDAQFSFDNLLPDIKQQTPLLVNFIGKKAYEVALYHYDPATLPGDYTDPEIPPEKDEIQDAIVENIQTYIITMAALAYMQSGDLEHGTAGRKQNRTEQQATPWEWQIDRDNAAHMKRAYRALDMLFDKLDELAHSSWTESDAHLKAKSLLIYNTRILDDIYPIEDSGQLYHRLIPFMQDHELESVSKILGAEKYTALQTVIKAATESALLMNDKILLNYARKAVAFMALADGYEMLPVEMFPDKVVYNENTTMRSKARQEKVEKLRAKGQLYQRNLEQHWAAMSANTATVQRDPLSGLNEDNQYVSL